MLFKDMCKRLEKTCDNKKDAEIIKVALEEVEKCSKEERLTMKAQARKMNFQNNAANMIAWGSMLVAAFVVMLTDTKCEKQLGLWVFATVVVVYIALGMLQKVKYYGDYIEVAIEEIEKKEDID